MAASTQPPLEAAWDEVVEAQSLSRHDSLERVIEAARDSETLLEASQQARVRRASYRSIATWFGITPPADGGVTPDWPPADLDERLATLERGELPDDARARAWLDGGGDDE